jgi:putative spermidine/putrescine transport system substrate-binding protein
MKSAKHSAEGRPAEATTRRDVLKYAAAAGGVLLGGAPLQAFSQATGGRKDLESQMVFGCNGGSTQKNVEKEFVPAWSKKTGVKVTYLAGQPAPNVAKVRAQKSAPPIDALWLAGAATYQAIDGGLMQVLDRSRVPHLAEIPPSVANEKMAAPTGVAVVGLFYNKEIFKQKGFAPPTSWLDMWDPKFKGHVGAYSTTTTASITWLSKISMVLTGQYKDSQDAFFAKAKDLGSNYYASAGAYETAIQQGDAWIGAYTSQRAKQLIDRGQPLVFVEPKEGFAAYPVWCGVVNNCKSPNAAHAWIDFLVSREGQEKIAKYIGYVPVNPNVNAPAGQEVFFPNINKVFLPDFRWLSANLKMLVSRWNREVER